MVHDEFGLFLDRIAPKQETMKALGERILRAAQEQQLEGKARRDSNDAEICRIDKEVEELIRMRTQGLVTDKEFVRLKSRLSERRITLKDMLSAEQHDSKRVQADLEEIMRPLSELRKTWNSVPVGFHRRFNQMVLPVGSVVGGYRTAELALFFRALSESGGMNSREVALTGENLNQLYQAIQAFADLFRSIDGEKKAA